MSESPKPLKADEHVGRGRALLEPGAVPRARDGEAGQGGGVRELVRSSCHRGARYRLIPAVLFSNIG